MKKFALIFFFFCILVACQPTSDATRTQQQAVATEKSTSKSDNPILSINNLMGETISPIRLTPEQRNIHEEKLVTAKAVFENHPDSLEAVIWYGRRLAYLGEYLDAIDVFSKGLQIFPHSYKLRRHRGHRYITIRQFERALEDLEMAAFYMVGYPNSTEPDGIPNTLGKPLSNDFFNIWYHFGLAHYLSGRYDKALSAYNKCMKYSDNPDLKVATIYWLYLTYKKLGNDEQAIDLLALIDGKEKLIENEAYKKLLLLHKGILSAEVIRKEAKKSSHIDPTLAYGLAQWYQHQGETEKTNEILLQIIENPRWDSFGHIAAEAELAAIFPVPLSHRGAE